ncbi:MAG TPA: ABC transporter substrate-binding protein [Actinomycetota bacterium]|nr:ABC transporter substrate-binding protein [Actinomycetota bacterium]
MDGTRAPIRLTVALAAFALVASACGQYAGVHEERFKDGQIPAGQTGVTSPTGAGSDVPASSGGTGGTTGEVGTTGTSPGSTTETGGPADASGSAAGAPGTTTVSGPGTTTGVTPTTIKLGLHAPLTGAAPLKAESFNRGKDMYWQKGNNGKPVEIFGRQVEVVFQDDQYNPSHARAVCAQMAEQQQVAILVGGGGTDQIQACAAYAATKGIPYVSVGTTEVGLTRLPNYTAVTMSYADQVPLLIEYMKANQSTLGWSGDPAKVAAVITNSPNFDDAASAFGQSLPGATMVRPDKNERGTSMAARLCTGTLKNFEVVFPLTSPTYLLEMAGSSKCNPQYVGVGISMGLNQVASVGCQTGGLANARFFSPAPAFADSNKYDPLFRQAGGADDIEFLLWGLWRSIHQLLVQAGPNLTREGFIQAASTATIKRTVFPQAVYSPTNHFGAKEVNVLRADCARREYVTEAAFKSSF